MNLVNQQSLSFTVQPYERSNMITIKNELNRIPEISFTEEMIGELSDGSKYKKAVPFLMADMNNEPYPIYNPETDEVIGETTDQQLQVLLYSKWKSLIKKRDEKISI